jgi:hypothetical protein
VATAGASYAVGMMWCQFAGSRARTGAAAPGVGVAGLVIALVAPTVFAGAVIGCGGEPVNGLGPVGDAGSLDATTMGSVCVPGQQVACACIGGGMTGAQRCTSDGRAFGTCTCPIGDASSSGGTDGSASPESGSAMGVVDGGGDAGSALLDAGCDCGTCQVHSDGVGQSYLNCTTQGTHTQPQARAACTAFTGDAAGCKTSSACCDDSLGLCITVQSTDAICGSVAGSCHCWSYVGNDSGTVQSPDGGCAEICPAAGDPGWN